MKRALLHIVITCLPFSAFADTLPLPDFDVNRHCENAARASGTLSKSILLVCLEQEQEAYNKLKIKWPRMPDDVQRVCLDEPSYQFVYFCLDREIAAAEKLKHFQFSK